MLKIDPYEILQEQPLEVYPLIHPTSSDTVKQKIRNNEQFSFQVKEFGVNNFENPIIVDHYSETGIFLEGLLDAFIEGDLLAPHAREHKVAVEVAELVKVNLLKNKCKLIPPKQFNPRKPNESRNYILTSEEHYVRDSVIPFYLLVAQELDKHKGEGIYGIGEYLRVMSDNVLLGPNFAFIVGMMPLEKVLRIYITIYF